MPKPRSKPTPAPPRKRARRLWWNVATAALALAVVAILVVLSAMPNGAPRRTSGPTPAKAAPVRAAGEADYARFAQLSARDLVAMSDAELEAVDPLVMNMVVAKGLPELADIDFAKYAGIVDGWAERIAEGSRRGGGRGVHVARVPGRSRHLASREHGYRAGKPIALPISLFFSPNGRVVT